MAMTVIAYTVMTAMLFITDMLSIKRVLITMAAKLVDTNVQHLIFKLIHSHL